MRLAQHPSHQVDYSKSLNFIFNNKRYKGYEGDTLASALLANDAFCLQEVLSMDENVALWLQVLKSQMPWYH